MTELFFVMCNAAYVDLGNRIFNTSNNIKLPLLFRFYFICYIQPFWLVLNSNLVNITDFTLSKFRYLILTE